MSLSVEALLLDRYKVINPYPNSPYKVGDLIVYSPMRSSFHITTTSYYQDGELIKADNYVPVVELENYTNLFHKLQWWEDRKPEEMPEYVKDLSYRDEAGNKFAVYKADFDMNETSAFFMFLRERSMHPYRPNEKYFLPATLEEYTTYISTNKQEEK